MVSVKLTERAGAVLCAVLVHALLLLTLLEVGAPAPLTLVRESEGPVFAVSLVSATGASSSPRLSTELRSTPLEGLRRRLAGGAGESTAVEERRPPASLAELFGEATGPAATPTTAGPPRSRGGDSRDQASVGRPSDGGSAPCWRLPHRPIPVRVRILLNDDGDLVGAPRILRPGGAAPDTDAETQALRAMAGCAPYVAAPPGRYRVVDLDFSRRSDIATPGGTMELR